MISVPIAQQFASRADAIVHSVQQTDYQHTSNIDVDAGIYDCDCSGFVSFVVGTLAPRHLALIPEEPNQNRPRAFMYYNYFAQLDPASSAWSRITSLREAQPGDIIAWRFPQIETGHDTGHVMFVAAVSPGAAPDEVSVAVYDSANTPHFSDTRGTDPGQFSNGVGSGTIRFQVGPEGEPTAFLFAPGDHFVALPIAIGRAGPIPS